MMNESQEKIEKELHTLGSEAEAYDFTDNVGTDVNTSVTTLWQDTIEELNPNLNHELNSGNTLQEKTNEINTLRNNLCGECSECGNFNCDCVEKAKRLEKIKFEAIQIDIINFGRLLLTRFNSRKTLNLLNWKKQQDKNILETITTRSERSDDIINPYKIPILNLNIIELINEEKLEYSYIMNILKINSIEFDHLMFCQEKNRKELIGRGTFCNVYKGIYKKKIYAIKEIFVNSTTFTKEQLLKKILLMIILRNYKNDFFFRYVQYGNFIYILLKYCTYGNLSNVLYNQNKIINEMTKKSWLLQIAILMHTLHSRKYPILYKDLKAENIFITENLEKVYLGVGIGYFTPLNLTFLNQIDKRDIAWMAPEVLENRDKYSTSSDVYSYGILMYQILFRCAPYESIINLETRILRGERPNIKKKINSKSNLITLMEQCWHENPLKRPNFGDIIGNLSLK